MSAKPLAAAMFDYHFAEAVFEHAMVDAGFGDFSGIGGDHYDDSIELYDVANDARLSEAAQRIIYDAGFRKAYVNHKDGWETHYTWAGGAFEPVRGWRRKRLANGCFLISELPAAWGAQGEAWVKSGYMTVVPDTLAPAAITQGMASRNGSFRIASSPL